MRGRAMRGSVFVSLLVVASWSAAPALALAQLAPLEGGAAEPSAATRAPATPEPATPAGAHGKDLARSLFESGVSLAREGRYADARTAFLRAYAAYPHYLVLYNVAQADMQLGDLRSARQYLERFLREGAGSLDAEREQEVRDQIDDLSRRLAAERTSPSASAFAESGQGELGSETRVSGMQPAPPGPAAPRSGAPSSSAAAPSSAPAPGPQLATPASHPTRAPRGEARPGVDVTGKSWGLILGGSGALLLGVASGLYFWNDGRHADWSRERADLDTLPNREQVLESDLAVWQRARANNDLLASIERVDLVTLLAAGIGALALGAGAWELLAPRTPPDASLVASGSTLSWRTTW